MGAWLLSELEPPLRSEQVLAWRDGTACSDVGSGGGRLEPQRLIDLGNQAPHIDLTSDGGGDQGGALPSGSRRSW
jgi:hypothetical protein